ncbi:MAG: nitric oxide reductase activation protein [Rhodocyclales bacterium]|nr:nitric oxide reductase activation protein [Rhodocyclales bacterium]
MPSSEPLDRAALGERLDAIFSFDVSSGRNYDELTEPLLAGERAVQEFALHWAKVAAPTHLEIAYLVVLLAPLALDRLGRRDAEAWVVAALDGFDRVGLRAAVMRLRDIEGFARSASPAAVSLDAIAPRLQRFLQGLAGRPLRVEADARPWTDTETVYLPPLVELATREASADRYLALAAMLWAQGRWGTYAMDIDAALADFARPDHALDWLALLEALRLGARLERELPGLRGEIAALLAGLPPQLDTARAALAAPGAGVDDSIAWLRTHAEVAVSPAPTLECLPTLHPADARERRAARIREQSQVLRLSIAELLESLRAGQDDPPPELEVDADPERLELEVKIDGASVTLPPEGLAAAQSLLQDLGEIAPELLVPAGPAEWKGDGVGKGKPGTLETRADALFDEWDYRRQAYRRQWCHVYLHAVGGGDESYVLAVRARHAPLIRQLRRRFEAMRGEDRVLRRQSDGQDVDMDALVAAIADRRGGAEPSPRLFCRRQRDERSLAAVFLVDMSGSTQGWINDAEREALVLLCEALEMLDDRYAIWGFSGWTRTRSDLYRIKEFDEAYGTEVQARIAAIQPRDYTRMGPPIRFVTEKLLAEPVRHRLLVTISDGRPDDFGDDYRSDYGIEDTRQALLEARRAGVRPFCITIDRQGADYLKRMYGPAAYAVLDEVRKLPLKVAEIYRKLTI